MFTLINEIVLLWEYLVIFFHHFIYSLKKLVFMSFHNAIYFLFPSIDTQAKTIKLGNINPKD